MSDVDRERGGALLSQAFRDGVLRVDEFDQRLSSAYAAQTVRDLDQAMRDLPRDWVNDIKIAEAAQRRSSSHRRRWGSEVRVYTKVMLLLIAIWLVTFVAADSGPPEISADGPPFFWPIWPMLGWGIPLFLSRPRDPSTRPVRDRRTAGAR
ncbi:MAG: DUF1707 domain-containing protein [Nitriliruptorales bacterium]|nr:DUF1707 domain-containing protein [Nitriliruptorales bacterium]